MSVAWVGVGVAAAGVLANAYSADQAGSAAKKAGKRADRADERRMDFEEKRYDEWQETYGPIEDRLADYYEALTPTLRITQGLEACEKEKGIAMSNYKEMVAQRNIDMSGMVAETERSTAIDSAEARAKIRADAPMQVAKEQARFLQIGLNQDPDQGMRTAMSGEQTRSASLERQTARNAGVASGAVIDSATDLAQAGLDKYAAHKPPNPGVVT